MRISDWSSDVCSSDLVYLRASEPIEPTRLQLQDADTGALILLDIAAEPPKDGEAELEPVRIVEGTSTLARYGDLAGGADEARPEERRVGKACVSQCRSRWSPYQ